MTQVIYIDSLLCVNLFVDYIMLGFVRRFLHIRAKEFRIVLSSVFGSLCTLAVFLPFYTTLFSVFYRVVTAILIVLIAFGYSSVKKLLTRAGVFFGISMAFCGGVFVIITLLKPKGVTLYADAVYFDISPTVLLVSTTVIYVILSILDKLNAKRAKSEIVTVTVYVNDNDKITFESFVDTGCTLKEPFSGLPVIVAEKTVFDNTQISENKLRVIPFGTMSKEGIIYGFKTHRLYIRGKEVPGGCYIGLCEEKLKGEVKSIMGLELLQ